MSDLVDDLVTAGIDPLEAFWIPTTPAVAEIMRRRGMEPVSAELVARDRQMRIDNRLREALDKLSPDLKARLAELIRERIREAHESRG